MNSGHKAHCYLSRAFAISLMSSSDLVEQAMRKTYVPSALSPSKLLSPGTAKSGHAEELHTLRTLSKHLMMTSAMRLKHSHPAVAPLDRSFPLGVGIAQLSC
jgi:hypothetical protein